MRAIANGDAYKVPATIEDTAVLDHVEKILRVAGHVRTDKP